MQKCDVGDDEGSEGMEECDDDVNSGHDSYHQNWPDEWWIGELTLSCWIFGSF